MGDVLDEFREWKARWPDRLSTHYIGCYVNHHECMIHRLAAEVERLRNGASAGRETVTDHDAAPAATASLPTADHAVCRGRESGCGTGDTSARLGGAA